MRPDLRLREGDITIVELPGANAILFVLDPLPKLSCKPNIRVFAIKKYSYGGDRMLIAGKATLSSSRALPLEMGFGGLKSRVYFPLAK